MFIYSSASSINNIIYFSNTRKKLW